MLDFRLEDRNEKYVGFNPIGSYWNNVEELYQKPTENMKSTNAPYCAPVFPHIVDVIIQSEWKRLEPVGTRLGKEQIYRK